MNHHSMQIDAPCTTNNVPDFPPGLDGLHVQRLIKAIGGLEAMFDNDLPRNLISLAVDDRELSVHPSCGTPEELFVPENAVTDDFIVTGRMNGEPTPIARRVLQFMVGSHSMPLAFPLCYYLLADVNYATISSRTNQVVSFLQSYGFIVLTCGSDNAPAKKHGGRIDFCWIKRAGVSSVELAMSPATVEALRSMLIEPKNTMVEELMTKYVSAVDLLSLNATVQFIDASYTYFAAITRSECVTSVDDPIFQELDEVASFFKAWKAGGGHGFISEDTFSALIRSTDAFKEVTH
ncbi:hypothetical protein H9P43_000370 [Blastocladiella emersonii ATCC 22665]|nr:hypothetical protein H9P43_000370 [Blastocladiella emersonii ATCC 22665]